MCNPAIFFVIGATGTGKTAASVLLARRLKEHHQFRYICVINADVLQFYSGLPVATNKANREELLFSDGSPIPHFFLSFLSHHGTVERSPTVDYHRHDFTVTSPAALGPSVTARDASATGNVQRRLYHIHDYVKDVMAFLTDVVFPAHCCCTKHSPEPSSQDDSSPASACHCCAVIFCGGSNYYVQALLFDKTLVPSSPSLRDSVPNEPALDHHPLEDLPAGSPAPSIHSALPVDKDIGVVGGDGEVVKDDLWRKLHAIDSRAAETVHPRNVRRVQRLLEIYNLTGRLPSEVYAAQQDKDKPEQWHCRWSGKVALRNDCVIFPTLTILWVDGDRNWLDARINRRLEAMVQSGLIDEIREFSRLMVSESLGTKRGREDFPHDESSPLHTNNHDKTAGEASFPFRRNDGETHDGRSSAAAAAPGTIAEAIGFKEWIPFLQATASGEPQGVHGEPKDPLAVAQLQRACLERAQAATRRYARQQVQWIRNRFLSCAARRAFASPSEESSSDSACRHRPALFLKLQMNACLASEAVETAVHAACDAALHSNACRLVDLAGMEQWVVDVLHPSVLTATTPEAAQTLMVQQGERDKKTLQYCSVCDMHLCGELQWRSHVSSKRHRGALRHAALVEEQKLLGRTIPSRTRNQQR